MNANPSAKVWFLIGMVLMLASCPAIVESQEIGKVRTIEAKATMVHLANGLHVAPIDFGALSAGGKFVANIKIQNPGKHDVAFTTVRSSCSCSEIRIKETALRSKEATAARVEFSLPQSNRDGKFGFGIDFFDGPNHVLRMNLTASIRGNLHLERGRNHFVLKPGVNRVLIPLTVSNPISLEDLEINQSDSLDDAALKIIKHKGQDYLELLVHSDLIEDSCLAGTVGVRDPASGKQSEISLFLCRTEPFVLSPSLVRFTGSRNATSGKAEYVGKVYIQFHDAKLLPSKPTKPRLKIGKQFANQVETSHLAKSVIQIVVRLDNEEAKELSKQENLQWQIPLADDVLQIDSKYYLVLEDE